MMNGTKFLDERKEDFRVLNEISRKGGVVFFGGNYFCRMNVNELAGGNEMAEKIYDRSVENLRLTDSFDILEDGVYNLRPAKIFVNIGETDCDGEDFSEEDFVNKYEWLLLNLHRHCVKSKIYIVSVVSRSPAAKRLNKRLANLAAETGCTFIDITREANDSLGFERAFNAMKPYMRIFPVKFAQAMA